MRVDHELKLQRKFWVAKVDGRKPWELRNDLDRDFETDDTVLFVQVTDDWDRAPTGITHGPVRITYILNHHDADLIPEGHCIFTHTQA